MGGQEITTHLGILGQGVEEDADAVPRGWPLQDGAYLAPAAFVPDGLRVPSRSARGPSGRWNLGLTTRLPASPPLPGLG